MVIWSGDAILKPGQKALVKDSYLIRIYENLHHCHLLVYKRK